MRSIAVVIITLSAAAVYGQQQVCVSPTGRSVRSSGTGRIRLPPDRVSFSVGVETEAASVSEGLNENSRKALAVVAALKAAGVAVEDIQTSELQIRQREEDRKRVAGFRVANRVSVTLKDPKAIGSVLQAAINAGANQADGPRFFVADQAALRDRGFELAFADARAQALKLAALSGKALGDLVCLAEGGDLQVGNLYAMSALAPVEVGLEEVVFNVSAVFELK
jgi:uncharacterized protein YggE